MTLNAKTSGPIIIALITALAILVCAYLFRGTQYENAWLYILVAGSILTAAFEVCLKKTEKK
jgi:hypothetical protein